MEIKTYYKKTKKMPQIKIESRPTIKKVEKAIITIFGLYGYNMQYVTKKDVYSFLICVSNSLKDKETVKILCSRSLDATWLDIGIGCEQARAEQILSQIKNEIEKNV